MIHQITIIIFTTIIPKEIIIIIEISDLTKLL